MLVKFSVGFFVAKLVILTTQFSNVYNYCGRKKLDHRFNNLLFIVQYLTSNKVDVYVIFSSSPLSSNYSRLKLLSMTIKSSSKTFRVKALILIPKRSIILTIIWSYVTVLKTPIIEVRFLYVLVQLENTVWF